MPSDRQQLLPFGQPPEKPARRGNLVIEAGAGTGKTTAIVAEVLQLMLEHEELAAERIVLMTFTEKAAGEIADRTRLALAELREQLITPAEGNVVAQWPPESAQPLLTVEAARRDASLRAVEHHLENIDALRSQTIHSFCQSLLRTFPIEAGLDPQFKIVQGFERNLLYSQIYDAWLDEETRINPLRQHTDEWELLFTHAGYLFQIQDLVLSLSDRRDLLEEEGYGFGELTEVTERLIDALTAIRRSDVSDGDDAAQRIFRYIREHEPPRNGEAIELWTDYLQPIATAIRDANLPRNAVLKDALKVLRASPAKGHSVHERLVSHRAAMALIAMTRRFLAFLDAEKRKLGVVDFDDLLLRTLALLRDREVLQRARDQFDFIFVDEFQDTDRTQAQIIELLGRDEGGAWVDGKIVVVGDPKQSIYGFRRADPETYHRMTEALVAGGAKRRTLPEQYRSDPPLVDAINAMFGRLFPQEEHDANVFRPVYAPLRAARRGVRRDLDARMTLLRAGGDALRSRHAGEAEAIAAWIHANRDRTATDLQRFGILFRRMTRLEEYLRAFDRLDIPYVLPPTTTFFDQRAPVDMLAVLRAIAWKFDRGAQISAARTPYFALSDEEIASGLGAGNGPAEAWHRFEETMERFRRSARQLTVSELIDLVVSSARIDLVYAAAVEGTRHLQHLEHLRSIAFDYDLREGGSVRQFVDEITRRRAEPEETEPSLVDPSQNAVRIMTVHAAKGLEFDTVILPDLSFAAGSSDHTQLFTVEAPRSLVLSGRAQSISANFRDAMVRDELVPLKKIASERERAELRRLFYVGVTRAKSEILFVCSLGDEVKFSGFLECLGTSLGADRQAFPLLWQKEGRDVRRVVIGGTDVPVAFETSRRPDEGTSVRGRLTDAALERELAAGPLVAVELPAVSDVATLSTAEVAARRAGSRNREAGILLHRVLELWDGRSPSEPILRQAAAESGADEESTERVRRRLATITRSSMFTRIARAETIGREYPLRFAQDGVMIERRIDRLLREPSGELVVDYKSGRPEPSRVERDREQVALYCSAVSAITGRPCRGALWYIGLEDDAVVEV